MFISYGQSGETMQMSQHVSAAWIAVCSSLVLLYWSGTFLYFHYAQQPSNRPADKATWFYLHMSETNCAKKARVSVSASSLPATCSSARCLSVWASAELGSSGGQRSSPLSTSFPSVGSTTIEGSLLDNFGYLSWVSGKICFKFM